MILLSGLATTFEVIYLYIITKRPAVVINLDFVDKSAKIWSKVVQNLPFPKKCFYLWNVPFDLWSHFMIGTYLERIGTYIFTKGFPKVHFIMGTYLERIGT